MNGDHRISLAQVRRQLRKNASAADAIDLRRFFKTGPGEYGEGDCFLGVRVPAIRRLVRTTAQLAERPLMTLLQSRFHEERLLALLGMVWRFQRGDPAAQERHYDLYLRHTAWINNWDLVDLSAPQIVGGWLLDRPRERLDDLAASACLWERRIAVLATLAFIRRGDFADTLRMCHRLRGDRHDLMHKACGWMLREVGKRDVHALRRFLRANAATLPRTMLRYAIEKFPEAERQKWLAIRPTARLKA